MQQQLSIKLWFMEATATGALPVFLVFFLTVIAFALIARRRL